ncbi:MAG: hypothetical protein MJ185_04970 [Treponema sp.]|nr:hypothetical protein [Treponema sp.]
MDNLFCEVRTIDDTECTYVSAEKLNINLTAEKVSSDQLKSVYQITLKNENTKSFSGVIHIKVARAFSNPKFFMPGYMYNRNTADMPSSGRKAFPRIRKGGSKMPESEFFMTRSDRLAEPVSLIYGDRKVLGLAAEPGITRGFSCNINDNGLASAGYTLGYENAPWLFVQTATVKERAPLTSENTFTLEAGADFSFSLTVYDYAAEDERAVYEAIEDVYWQYHQAPRKIEGMDSKKAVSLLSAAIRDYSWLEEEKIYSGFVYDRPDGLAYNRIPSLTWTNGLAVAVPMLMAANNQNDEKAREQSLTFISKMINESYNPDSGFMYESVVDGKYTARGWWYDGMHSGGHSSYLNGQAIYYILKAYANEKQKRNIDHSDWLDFAQLVVSKMNTTLNTDFEYPFAMSEKTGAGLEYDSMGGAWFLAATAMYELQSGDTTWISQLLKTEEYYYRHFVSKVECYGGPLDTDKAVDSEGILSFVRAARILHELTGHDYLLDHLRDALYYEFTFKLGYNTEVTVRPLSEIGWSSCGGSITSVANPHIHPMSSTIIDEMAYYLKFRQDKYIASRMEDTIGWGLQTFNTKDKEYGYGKPGWMSERFCFCQGLLVEKYPDGEIASTWFALMAWAAASIIEGFVN